MSNNPGKMEGGDSDGPMEETLHGHKKSVHKKPNWLAHIINPDSQRSIARHYLKSGFFLDLFSLLPSEIVVISVRKRSRNRAFSLFRLNRLLRFWTVMSFLGKFEIVFGVKLNRKYT